jgi:hypothetical protein
MAYLAFDLDGGSAIDSCRNVDSAIDFTSREWLVIEMARRDGARALPPASRIARLLQNLFGIRIANPLADPRLEALRRAAVQLWHRSPELDAVQTGALRDQGYSLWQTGLLSGHIADSRRL